MFPSPPCKKPKSGYRGCLFRSSQTTRAASRSGCTGQLELESGGRSRGFFARPTRHPFSFFLRGSDTPRLDDSRLFIFGLSDACSLPNSSSCSELEASRCQASNIIPFLPGQLATLAVNQTRAPRLVESQLFEEQAASQPHISTAINQVRRRSGILRAALEKVYLTFFASNFAGVPQQRNMDIWTLCVFNIGRTLSGIFGVCLARGVIPHRQVDIARNLGLFSS
jgi:hypothetical protein